MLDRFANALRTRADASGLLASNALVVMHSLGVTRHPRARVAAMWTTPDPDPNAECEGETFGQAPAAKAPPIMNGTHVLSVGGR